MLLYVCYMVNVSISEEDGDPQKELLTLEPSYLSTHGRPRHIGQLTSVIPGQRVQSDH